MAAKLFKLRNVPDDEANDIRQLLEEHRLSCYETDAGAWGISVPAIWLHESADLEQAKALIDDYQRQRAIRMQAEHQRDKAAGQHATVWGNIKKKPIHFVLLVMAVLFVLYVSLSPFMRFLE